ncbi:hypothetical protein Fot_09593 [Forsythia ovata]|uniref:Uncharacterized protein n=1 Tax=Forsythia ovata TaxID=205694 RepID=A0ABD1WGZ8_9LAMI
MNPIITRTHNTHNGSTLHRTILSIQVPTNKTTSNNSPFIRSESRRHDVRLSSAVQKWWPMILLLRCRISRMHLLATTDGCTSGVEPSFNSGSGNAGTTDAVGTRCRHI